MLTTCLRFTAEEKCSIDAVVYYEHGKWFSVLVLEFIVSEKNFLAATFS